MHVCAWASGAHERDRKLKGSDRHLGTYLESWILLVLFLCFIFHDPGSTKLLMLASEKSGVWGAKHSKSGQRQTPTGSERERRFPLSTSHGA